MDLRLYAHCRSRARGRARACRAGAAGRGKAARRWCSCATRTATTRAMIEEARAIKEALAPYRRAAADQRPRRCRARLRAPTACMSGRTTWRSRMRGALLGRDAIIGLSIKTVGAGAAAPLDLLDYVGIGGVFRARPRRTIPIRRSRPAGFARHRRGARSAPRSPNMRDCRDHAALRGVDRGRRRRLAVISAAADGVAVISALIAR